MDIINALPAMLTHSPRMQDPALDERGRTNATFAWHRPLGNQGYHPPPHGKPSAHQRAMDPVALLKKSKALFDDRPRAMNLLDAKDVNIFHVFLKNFDFALKFDEVFVTERPRIPGRNSKTSSRNIKSGGERVKETTGWNAPVERGSGSPARPLETY